MTTEQYWASLDSLASSKGTDRLLEAAELLCAHPELPLPLAVVVPTVASSTSSRRLMSRTLMQQGTDI